MFNRFRKAKPEPDEADPHLLMALGVQALQNGEKGLAVQLLTGAAATTDPTLLSDIGCLLLECGRRDNVYTAFRRGADQGGAAAMHNLGVLYKQDDLLDEAERWWRAACEHGNTESHNSLANLLRLRGDPAGALRHYRLGAEAGSPDAMANMVLTLVAAGDRRVEPRSRGAVFPDRSRRDNFPRWFGVRRLGEQNGMDTLVSAWRSITGERLPLAVRLDVRYRTAKGWPAEPITARQTWNVLRARLRAPPVGPR
ncbi:SEL1-like repeat protein [Actinoplanes derwentensis]|uniref:TPR repeat n=1 Tax=Actinoplanes derwentensis TaxID=113562 RepID=A0A1H1T576_9ACTN|nr:tetratricopeptide repeat protein [Actinoplanes derwentensis]GID88985.1 hypothetical protein Ade03nite_79090 [Actinoplanes derwentensis]SDS55340.1 hypothetical protein SAMN04489716_1039 [Actinoplanes derwentensis]